MPLAALAVLIATLSWAAAPQTTQPTPVRRPRPTTAPATQPAADPVVRILDAMEAMGDAVADLRCRVDYTVEDLVGLDEFTKFGTLVYKRTQPNPHFKVTFFKMHQGGIVVRRKEWYLFALRWFYEAKEASRTIIKREVIREGEVVDLFSLERSPFPIPFGQRKDEILEHFTVELVPSAPDDPKNTDHLVCIPKPGSRLADEYSRLEFFVSRSLHLPVKIIATQADPDGQASKIITAVFPDLTRKWMNTGVPLNAFKLPPETSRYQLIEEPLDRPGGEVRAPSTPAAGFHAQEILHGNDEGRRQGTT